MGGEGSRPEGRAQDRREGQAPGGHGAAPAGHTRAAACWRASPAVPPLPDVFTTALFPVVRQDAGRPGPLQRRERLGGFLTDDACDTAGVL
jgi:hypothetical protein